MSQTLLPVGDIFVQRDDPPSVFQHIRDLLKNADFSLATLKGREISAVLLGLAALILVSPLLRRVNRLRMQRHS